MKNKSYTEDKGYKPFNFLKFLKKKKFSFNETYEAMRQAKSWPTCACGVQCVILPRDTDGRPNDGILEGFGIQFMRQMIALHLAVDKLSESLEEPVSSRNTIKFRARARRTFEKIEKRSLYLIRKIQLQNANRK